MRCIKCGLFVTREVVEAVEDDSDYIGYIHVDKTECVCTEIYPTGTYDGTESIEGTRFNTIELTKD